MIKDGDSLYTPGSRGGSWIKFKKELATLEVVVVGVEEGHGKRSHLLSDYTFAVRDEESGTLQTIGKAYSGLRDEEIEELTEHFLRTTAVALRMSIDKNSLRTQDRTSAAPRHGKRSGFDPANPPIGNAHTPRGRP